MLLITEHLPNTEMVVEDTETGSPSYYIKGVFMQSGIKNRNNRMYPKEVMNKQLYEYNQKFILNKRALGELGHPTSPTVNLERVSHNIVSLEYANDQDVVGKAKLMDTPYGNIAKSLVQEGVKLGVSSRGLGTLKETEGVSVVQNDFFLAAIDIVADPSAPGAFVNGIMENKEWVLQDGILVEQDIEEIQANVNEAAKKGRTESEILAIFQSILQKI